MSEAVTFDTMTYQVNDKGIAIITIDVKDQRMNILTPELHRDTGKVAEQLKDDINATGAIICSGKSSFVAGGDLKRLVRLYEIECTATEAYERVSVFSRSLRKLETCGKPVVAVINGAALGGGLELALACHHRVVADDDNIVLGLPETTVGLMPGAGGTQRLPRLVGIKEATSLILSGRHIKPVEALELGIVDKIVAAEKIFSQAECWLLEAGDPVQPWDKKGFQVPGGAGLSNMKIARHFQDMATQVAIKTKYNYPAPITALKSICKGTSVLSIDTALQIESRYFSVLSHDVVARNMIRTLFLNKGLLDRLQKRPKGMNKKSINSVALIGKTVEVMPLACVCESAGIKVILYDAHDKQPGSSDPRSCATIVTNKRADLSKVDLLVILSESSLKELIEAINATPETATVFVGIDKPIINGMADAGIDSARLIRWHLSSTPEQQLVEIVESDSTTEKALACAMDFTRQLRKTPTIQKDSPLRFSQHCLFAYIKEGVRMLTEGIDPILIENVALNAGMKLGPLALADAAGLHKLPSLLTDKPSHKLIHNMIEDFNRTGKQHSKGFYDYGDNNEKLIWQGVMDILPANDALPDDEKIRQRLLCAQALPASQYWGDGIITAIDADIISVLDWGFPSYTGGVLSYIDTMGVNNFLSLCQRLTTEFGELFCPSKQLVEYAQHSDRIYQMAA